MEQTRKNILKSISLLAFLLVSVSFVSPKNEIAGRQPIITPGKTGTLNKEAIMTRAASVAVPFVKNVGQFNGKVTFSADLFGGRFFLTDKEFVYSLFKLSGNKKARTDRHRRDAEPQEKVLGKGLVFREYFVDEKNARIDFKSSGEQQAETMVSDFKGNDAGKWRNGMVSYQSVSLGEVYPGIEVKLKASCKNVEKIFYVSPQGDVTDIKIKVEGVDGLDVAADGRLMLKNSLGEVVMRAPVAWQEIAGQRQEVKVRYLLPDKGLYGFTITGDYDANYPLVIDPDLDTLMASTFLGGGGIELGTSLALDSSGNVYITGYTTSANFPATSGAYSLNLSGLNDIFVSKLDGDLTTLLASTYLGGSDDDVGRSLVLDISGNVYITGYTNSTDFPTTPGAYDRTFTKYPRFTKAFVSKLDSNLTTLLASTFLGGSFISGEDGRYLNEGNSLALDRAGNVYLTGYTGSMDFPTTPGAYDRTFNGSWDVFISKLDGSLTTLLASTLLGGSSQESGHSLALDSAGNVYLTGETYFSDFPTTPGAYNRTFNGSCDVFVSKLDSSLTTLLASTLLGGSSMDWGSSLALDSAGNVYLTGGTVRGFPTTPGAYDRTYKGGEHIAFISKLDRSLSTLSASTLLGGSSQDMGLSLALDSSGNVYITGYTSSADFPTTSGAYDRTLYGYSMAFISNLDSGLTKLLASTYLGGNAHDYGYSLALSNSGMVYLTGRTMSVEFPTTPGAYDRTSQKDYEEAFVSKLNGKSIAVTSPNGGESWLAGAVHDIAWWAIGTIAAVRIEVSTDNGATWRNVSASTANDGTYPWTVPNTPSRQCLVRVSDAANAATSDASDSVFSILMDIDLQAQRREVRAFSVLRQYGRIQFLAPAPSNQAGAPSVTRRRGSDDFALTRAGALSELRNRQHWAKASSVQVAEYRLLRRKGSEEFVLLRTIAPSELQNDRFQMQDKYLEKDITYAYRVEAYDAAGQLVGRSVEKTI